MLIIRNVKKTFTAGPALGFGPRRRVAALRNVDAALQDGDSLGLVGESGSGKTTLAKIIAGFLAPDAGEVLFEGRDLLTMPRRERAQAVQMVFQDPFSSIDPRKTVRSIIGEGFDIQKTISRKEQNERINSLMETVGLLPEHANRFPHEFSGGQRQRICVARALALQPKMVIADEPVSALDVSIQAQILNLFVALQSQFDLTYLFISHDLGVVRHISDRVAVMYLGRIVEIGTSSALFQHPLHPYTHALISAIPVPNPFDTRKAEPLPGDVPSPISPPSGCSFNPRCRRAMEQCRHETPMLREKEEEHLVACHSPVV